MGITNVLPASGLPAQAAYTIEGEPEDSWKLKFSMFANTYGDYFHAMGIPLVDGRIFTLDDRSGSPLVVIVNQSMARHSWPGKRAIGKRMHVGNPHKGLPWATVVGVVADSKAGSLDEPDGDQWYSPAQQPAILYGSNTGGKLTAPAGGYISLRSALPPEEMTQTLRAAVAEIDPLLALQEVQPMSDVISNVEAPRRFNTGLITAFAVGAVVLAISGIYAVVAFSISLRTQEIAIRMALGARRSGIAQLVLVSGAKLALLGCGLGVLGSLVVSRLVRSFLFEVSATDPLIYAAGRPDHDADGASRHGAAGGSGGLRGSRTGPPRDLGTRTSPRRCPRSGDPLPQHSISCIQQRRPDLHRRRFAVRPGIVGDEGQGDALCSSRPSAVTRIQSG